MGFERNMEKSKKKTRILLIAILLTISLGYALLSATLTINGNSKITQQTWDIHWNNVQVTNGSVSIGTGDKAAVITPGDTTEVTYEVTLAKPGDFYEFTVDAVNAGTVDAMIDEVRSTYKIGEGEVTTITSNNLPAYLDYSVAYSDGTALAQYQELKAGTTETLKARVSYKSDIDESDLPDTLQSIVFGFAVDYVQADSNAVEVRVTPVSFADDEWDTIIAAAQAGNTSAYTVGATKTVDMGTFGTHTLRVANNSTPAECSTAGFSETACGFVLEFADIITTHVMNSTYTNVGGWPASEMRTYVNSDIYNALPTLLKNAIIDTTVVSGHGSTSGETNFTSTDKLYLLSTHEVWEDVDGNTNSGLDSYDSAYNNTRQLDYYAGLNITTSSYSWAIKQYNGSNTIWWLRAPLSSDTNRFHYVDSTGGWDGSNLANGTSGVAPAFRIG